MAFFVVVRPVLIMQAVIVEAKNNDDARSRVAKGEGWRYYNRSEEPSLKMENMSVEPHEFRGDTSPGDMYIVQRKERHDQPMIIRAKSSEEAIKRIADGEGSQLLETEYRETEDPSLWTAALYGKK